MIDDPIFDPWFVGDAEARADDVAPSTEPLVDERGAGSAPAATGGESVRRWIAPTPSAHVPTVPRPSGRPTRPPESPHLGALRSVVRPRLEALRARLDLAGHDVVLDDRTHHEIPSVRFRFSPRHGPFDEPEDLPSSVLEVLWDVNSGQIAARIWKNAVDEDWSDEVLASCARVDDAWIDRVIVGFVERTLDTGA